MTQSQEVRAISERISRVEMARALIDAQKYDEALRILENLKGAYSDPKMREKVQFMIEDTLRKKPKSLISKISGRFMRPQIKP